MQEDNEKDVNSDDSGDEITMNSFDEALKFAKEGCKIARRGWNGAKLGIQAFIVLQKGYPEGIAINANTSEALGIPEKTVCAFEPYLMLACPVNGAGEGSSGPQYKCRPWTPDQRDQLSNDWFVVR